MHIGSHISIRHGYLGAAQTAVAIGATAFQYFPKNPRSLTIKEFDRHDAEACDDFSRKNGLLSISHTPYPSNLAADQSRMRKVTSDSLRNDLDISNACGSVGAVVHFGKAKGKDPLQAYKNIIQCINDVLDGWEGDALLLIENQAGEGGPMGTTLEELVRIRSLCERPDRIGFCFDTCHAFASGLWNGDWDDFAGRAERLGYLNGLKAVHLNDSMYPYHSTRDRHARLGEGHIGADSFRGLLRWAARSGVPCVLETDSGADGTHREQIAKAKELAAADENH